MPYDVMLSIQSWRKKKEGGMFGVTAFVLPSNCSLWWSPAFLDMAEHLPADVKEKILKNSEHLLTKAKQRKKRKRNKKVKDNHMEIMNEMLGGAVHHPIPDDQGTSVGEEDDLEEENSKSLCAFSEGPGEQVKDCEEQPNDDDESLKEAAMFSREGFAVAVSEVSVMSKSAFKDELPIERDSSLLIDAKPFSTESLTKKSCDDEETRHKEILCRSNFLKISKDESFIQETEGISEDYSTPLLSTESKQESYQIICEPDTDTRLLSLSGEEKEIPQCSISDIHDNVPGNNAEDKGVLKAKGDNSSAWAVLSVNLLTEELQLGFDTQVSLLSSSEDEFVGEQRPSKMSTPKQTQMNSSTQLNFYQSVEGLVKETHQGTVTEEANSVISNGLLTSPAGEVHCDSLVKTRATFTQCLNKANVPRSDAGPITSKRKRYRRIVNLAPKFDLPRQIAGDTEREKEVPIKDGFAQKGVLEVEQKGFPSKDCGEEHEQDCALQEFSYSDTKGTYSLPSPHADVLLHDISYIHWGQSSSTPKHPYRACADSTTQEKQQEVDAKKEDESEQMPSEATNSQPDILSSVKVVSEYLEDSSMLAGRSENVHEDDPEPSEASQCEDNQDLNMKCSFLGLPLSLGFAFQLVQLFGSPGLPLESLLPDDYIVPLDWKVSKMIYLLWKTSVEEKQKTNGMQNGKALADDIIGLENLDENCQENEDSSEGLPEMELFQGMMENVMTSTVTDCPDAVYHDCPS
ncbi:uncharacterized protein LOC135190985 isoform X2 [Pogoniulus pusillus]|uniref:uncharacterized protein LOC135190985 isoform X2 n=1 Tax=Pogoniulus pusillus TaxID=488313 RepID=UPI0030B924CB